MLLFMDGLTAPRTKGFWLWTLLLLATLGGASFVEAPRRDPGLGFSAGLYDELPDEAAPPRIVFPGSDKE